MAKEIRTCNVNDVTLHQSAAMLKTLRLFWEEGSGYLCDTTLLSRLDTDTDGSADNGNLNKIMAHAVVLAAFSPLLAQQLVKSHSGLYTIQTSMTKDKLKSFIEDIYKGVNTEDCQASLFNDFFTDLPEGALSHKIPKPKVINIEPDHNKDDAESAVPISSTKQTHESEQTLTVKHVEEGTQQQSMLGEMSIMKNDQLCRGKYHVDALVQVTKDARQATESASATSSSLVGPETGEKNLQKSKPHFVTRHNSKHLPTNSKTSVSGGCSVDKQSAVTQKPSHIQKRPIAATAKKSTLTTPALESKHLKCRKCSIMCKSKKSRAKHEMSCYGKKVATKAPLFMCRVCNRKCKNRGNKDSHEQFCLKRYAYWRCRGCTKGFVTEKDLRRHIDSQKVDGMLCEKGCRKRFNLKCLARAHRCYWSYPYDMYDGW